MYAEGKLDTDRWYPVVLLDDTDFKTGETGKVVAGLTIKYRRLGDAASWETYSPAAGDWQETGDGTYALNMGAGEFTTAKGAGIYQVQVACSGCLTFRFPVEVRKYLIQDFFSGYNVIMKLNQLDIESQVTNEPGIKVKGKGNGGGIQSTGGATGPGANFLGGATSGAGMILDAVNAGDGLSIYGRGAGGANGIYSRGAGPGSGAQFNGGVTGYGIKAYGGSTSGAAVYAEALAGNSPAVELLGFGTGAGILAQGGATGAGIEALGGSTNGYGIKAVGTEYPGLGAISDGVNSEAPGIYAEGGQAGGDGICAEGRGVDSCGITATAQGDGIRAVSAGGTYGHGIYAEGNGPNGAGLKLTSNEFSALYAKGYGDYHGIHAEGGSGQGCGIYAYGSNAGGAGIHAKGGSNAAGIKAEGTDVASGLWAISGTGATGDGIRAEAQSTNGNGINTIKTGTGIDLKASDHSDGTWGHSVKKNTAIAKYKLVMLHETSGDPEPGLTVTAVKKLDAAAAWSAMSGSGTIVDNGSGVYSIDISQADSNGDTGVWKFTAPGAKATIISLIFES
jgi:hypothetical protein